MIPDSVGGVVNFELDQNTLENLRPYIVGTGANTDSSGRLQMATLNSTLATSIGVPGATIFRILNMYTTTGKYPVRFVKHNNVFEYQNNVFKAPSSPTKMIYTVFSSYLQLYPVVNSFTIDLSVIRTPDLFVAGESPGWTDYMLNQIILQALKLAGISVSDTTVLEDIRISGIQSAQ
jgi:hypothetical protein